MPTTRQTRAAQELVITSSASTTGGIPISSYAGGVIYCDSLSSGAAATLRFYVKASPNDEYYYLLYNSSNQPIEVTIAPGRATEIPVETFASAWVSPVTTGLGSTASCKFTLKG